MRLLAKLAPVVALTALPTSVARADETESPTFTFGFAPTSRSVVGEAGASFDLDLLARITTSKNSSNTGVSGWTMSIVAEGAELTEISLQSTAAASVDDKPAGLRQNGFARAELAIRGNAECEGRSGAVAAVVLSLTEIVTLPPEGDANVARLTVCGALPAEPSTTSVATVRFADGCMASSGPVPNAVTFESRSSPPDLDEIRFALTASSPTFVRGDVHGDGGVSLDDALVTLVCKFLGGQCPDCLDAADANDDGRHDVSDAVFTLSYLFLGGTPPPPPGPTECGLDPTPDDLASECDWPACSIQGP